MSADWTDAHGQMPGSLELAYLGDALYELYVRRHLLGRGEHVRQLHGRAIGIVCAQAQARALALVEPILTQQERDVARRARNARQTPTKNAQTAAYHRATALEAVLGYLYLTGQQERLDDIMRLILKDGKE